MFSLRWPTLCSLCLKLIFSWLTHNTRIFFSLMCLPAGKADKWCINESCLKMHQLHQLQQICAWLPNAEQTVSGVGYWISTARLLRTCCLACSVSTKSPAASDCSESSPTHLPSKAEHIGSLVWGGSGWSSEKMLRSLKTEVIKCLNLYDSSQDFMMQEAELEKERDKTRSESINYVDAFLICRWESSIFL